MANDLVAKLRLDSAQWDNSINKSKRQMTDFKTSTSSMAMSGIKSFAGFAGGIVAAGGALATFEKFIGSTQTTADLFGNNMLATTSTVDAFFVSLNSGDWNAFSDGVIGAYKNMKVFADLMDELEDKKLSLTFIKSDDTRDLARFEELAKDTTLSRDTRIDNAQNYEGVVNHLSKKTKATNDLEIKTLEQLYRSRSGLNISKDDLNYFVKNTNFDGNLTGDATAIYKKSVELDKKASELEDKAVYDAKLNGYNPNSGIQKQYSDLQKISKEYRKQNEFMIKQGFLANEGDENRKKMVETLTTINAQEEEIYQLQTKSNKISKSAHKGEDKSNSTSTTKKEVKAKEGSVENLEDKLTKLKKDLKNATTDEARRQIQIKINELQKILNDIETKLNKSTSTPELLKSGSKITGQKTSFKSIKGDLASGNIKVQGVEPQKLIETNTDDLDYLNSMSNLMTSIAGATGAASDNWLSYTANVLAGIGQLLPQLFQVFGIKSKIAIAESAALPPPLNILAMAATAASLANTITGLPKFAGGGVVPGSSFVGDRVLASVNSGEMILNNTQQGKLFGLLNSGSGSGSGSGTSEVKFKITGKDLEGVLSNYKSKMSRI